MARVQIPLGLGLDRASGRLAMQPGTVRDIRNMVPGDGVLRFRLGHALTAEFQDDDEDDITQVCAGWPQQTERVGLVVGYQAATGKVFIYRVSALGEDPEILQVENGDAIDNFWFQLDVDAPPPKIRMTDVEGKVFLAHDEASSADRERTVYYDPTNTVPIRELYGFSDDDEEDRVLMYFRGVTTFLQYLVGWSFGDAVEDKPQYLRLSRPGLPLEFKRNGYFDVGSTGVPILNCWSTDAGLVIQKENDHWLLTGFSPTTFGIVPIDTIHGLAASRLSIPWRGGVAFWSSAGMPRWTDGRSVSVDIGKPLGLDYVEPSDLVEAGDLLDGFAIDDPVLKQLEFVFGRRSYALSYQNEERPQWWYNERAWATFCAFLLYYSTAESGGAGARRPIGYPAAVDSADWVAGSILDFSVSIAYDNIDARGGELIEVWLRVDGGGPDDWFLSKVAVVNAAADRETLTLQNLTPGTVYEYAHRYRSGGKFTEGYEGANPDEWVAATAALSMGTFATSANARVLASVVWSRTGGAAERITLTLAGGPAVSTDVLEENVNPPMNVETNLAIGVVTYDWVPAGGEEETQRYFQVQPNNGGILGVLSAVVPCWCGPQRPLGYALDTAVDGAAPRCTTHPLYVPDNWGDPSEDPINKGVIANFVLANIIDQVEIWVDDGGGYALQITTAAGENRAVFTALRGVPNVMVKMRTKRTQFATVDYSDYSAAVNLGEL